MINILLPEEIPSLNKGEAAILAGMLESFKILGEHRVSIFSSDPDTDREHYGSYGVEVIDSRKIYCRKLTWFKSRTQLLKFAFTHLGFLLLYKIFGQRITKFMKSDIWNKYFDSDLIVLAHDNAFFPLYHSVYIIFFRLLKKKIAVYGGSMLYVENRWLRIIVRSALNKVDLITLREELSYSNVKRMGIHKPPMYVTADLAFLLPPASLETVKEVMRREDIEKGNDPLIGITLSQKIIQLVFREAENPEEKYEEFIGLMANVINYLIDSMNAKIIFICHSTCHHSIEKFQDDRVAGKSIYPLINNKDKFKVIHTDYSPEILKRIIGHLDLLIGSRCHSLIAATSMGVPVIGLTNPDPGEVKTPGIIGKMLAQEKFICRIDKIDFETLRSKINDVWSNRPKIVEDLKKSMPDVRSKTLQNGKLIKDVYDRT